MEISELEKYKELLEKREYGAAEDVLHGLEPRLKEEMDNYIHYKYNVRKLIMPIDDEYIRRLKRFIPDCINVFRMSNIPNCIKFPVGHPISRQLYIGHPLKPELYVPYETYEETFFVDKVHELCHLLQCLGATEITIESVKGRNVSELYNNNLSVNADVGIKAFSGSGSYDRNYTRESGETSNSRRAMHFTFDPMYKPYVPKDLVWYPESTEWQRLVQNRIDGNMLEYSEYLSTAQTRIVNSIEEEKIKASAEYLWAKANVNVAKSTSNNFKESIETEWKVSVTFHSIKKMDECAEYQLDSKCDSGTLDCSEYTEHLSGNEDVISLMNAAARGDAVAQYSLGICYSEGDGVQQDYRKAFEWFEKSAEQGNADSQYCLGVCYSEGEGVRQDYRKAFEWFEKSAEQGDALAQNYLGVIYELGRGVNQNYNKALELYNLAFENGHEEAQKNIDRVTAILNGDNTTTHSDNEQGDTDTQKNLIEKIKKIGEAYREVRNIFGNKRRKSKGD